MTRGEIGWNGSEKVAWGNSVVDWRSLMKCCGFLEGKCKMFLAKRI